MQDHIMPNHAVKSLTVGLIAKSYLYELNKLGKHNHISEWDTCFMSIKNKITKLNKLISLGKT